MCAGAFPPVVQWSKVSDELENAISKMEETIMESMPTIEKVRFSPALR